MEQRTRAPPDGLKRGWEGARLPPVLDHQARALDPVDPGGGGRRVNGLAGFHPHQVIRVLNHKEHVIGVRQQTSRSSGSQSTNPFNLRRRKGSIARAYSWPERGHPAVLPAQS
ncbi:unnamed protein product [Caretta caretta]